MENKIFLFGTYDDIQTMQKRLQKTVYVCGYVDLDTGKYDSREMEQVIRENDSIVLVFANLNIKKDFDASGISVDCRYVIFSEFENTTYKTPIDGFAEGMWTGLILGMSHSQCALDVSRFSKHQYFMASSPSMDLFLQVKYVEKLANDYPEKLYNIEKIILEIPYYIFNYDLSRFGEFTLTKLKYFDTVGDFHNFSNEEQISRYRLFVELFGEPVSSYVDTTNTDTEFNSKMFYSIKCKNKIKKLVKYPLRLYRIVREKHNVWEKFYSDTNKENTVLFEQLLEIMHTVMPNASITVVVMPFNPIFRISHRASISEKKSDFITILEKCGMDTSFRYIDDFNYFNKDNRFDDHCHLNKNGGQIYTEHLRKHLEA